MANTYTQLYVHIVFAAQTRQCLIRAEFKEELQKYMTGIISNNGQILIAINNMPGHFHILVGLKPDIALSDLVRDIKAGSSSFINDRGCVRGRFAWQEGFGAFSYSHSQLTTVIRYIQNQERHHARQMFRAEYLELLDKFDVPYDERYIFKPIESGSGPVAP